MAFFIIFVGKIFFLQNIYGFTPVKKILSHLDQKWAKTKQLLLKKFQLLIAMEGCIVQCDYVSSHVEHLNKHLKFGGKPNRCKKYDYTSSRVNSLREYLKTHTGERANKCSQCDFASTQTNHLKRHLKTHSE